MGYEITFLVSRHNDNSKPEWNELTQDFGAGFVEVEWGCSFFGHLLGMPEDIIEITDAYLDYMKRQSDSIFKQYDDRMEWLSRAMDALKPGYDGYAEDVDGYVREIMDLEKEQADDWKLADGIISFLETLLKSGKCKVWACPSY